MYLSLGVCVCVLVFSTHLLIIHIYKSNINQKRIQKAMGKNKINRGKKELN